MRNYLLVGLMTSISVFAQANESASIGWGCYGDASHSDSRLTLVLIEPSTGYNPQSITEVPLSVNLYGKWYDGKFTTKGLLKLWQWDMSGSTYMAQVKAGGVAIVGQVNSSGEEIIDPEILSCEARNF